MATAIGSNEPGSVAISNLGEGDLSGTIVLVMGFLDQHLLVPLIIL